MLETTGLVFLNPEPQLRRTDVTAFCMQFENQLARQRDWGERGCVTQYKGERREKGNTSFLECT